MNFFINATATTVMYPLSRHDALPVWGACRRRSAGAYRGASAQGLAGSLVSRGAGTGRGGPHARHGIPGRAGGHRRGHADDTPDAVVQRHLRGQRTAGRRAYAARTGEGRSGLDPRRAEHSPALPPGRRRTSSSCCAMPVAAALPAGIQRGVLQYQARDAGRGGRADVGGVQRGSLAR